MTPATHVSSTEKNLDYCLKAISGRWKLRIIRALFREPARFSVLQRRTKGISKRILTHQLKELEALKIVRRVQKEESSSVVHIEITDAGRALIPVIVAMEAWAMKHAISRPTDTQT